MGTLGHDYKTFLESKVVRNKDYGFKPLWIPDFLFPFQRDLVSLAIEKGRLALFEDCGLGKGIQALVWAENVVRHTNKSVLIAMPLAVSAQMVREGEKFGIEVKRSRDGRVYKGINVTNYEQLHKFNPKDFAGMVCDESAILKNFDGKTRKLITEFLHQVNYRLLCTATPAPNDFMELGTSSEALGEMGRNQMLGMFFTNDGETTQQWRLKGHAKGRFWRWVGTWARAVRKPSDLGYDNAGYDLPELKMVQYTVKSKIMNGSLLPRIAKTLGDQRQERRETIGLRCKKVAEIVPKDRPCLVWCHLNPEGDLLEELIDDAVQIAGSDRDEVKEERFMAFVDGQIRVLVSKPKIGGWGLNFQHCADMVTFPSHSFESWYQSIRRCWRFGQKNPVTVSIVTSESERLVLSNMQRKEQQAREMYDSLVRTLNQYQQPKAETNGDTQEVKVPSWLR